MVIDVHARDVVHDMVEKGINTVMSSAIKNNILSYHEIVHFGRCFSGE